MPKTIESALWGKRDGRARPRIAAAALALVFALAVPALAQAGGGKGNVPPQLLEQASANPAQMFAVIVQSTDGVTDPADATVSAIIGGELKGLKDAIKAANELAKNVDHLGKKAANSTAKAAKAQQKATDLAAKAAQTGKPDDQAAAAKAQADAAQDLADAQADQAALSAAQASFVSAQIMVSQAQVQAVSATGKAGQEITHRYQVIPAVAAEVSGSELVALADDDSVAISPDTRVRVTESNPQKWVEAVDAKWYWKSSVRKRSSSQQPTIAIIDSGIDASGRENFDRRVLGQVDFTSGTGPNSPGDGRGHGTMVASLAAGGYDKRTGTNPDARLLSLDVIDDNGEGRTSDVIAAIDWILANKSRYGIRVANFSLQAAVESTFLFDPLSIAVERLWLNGVVVVAAAGNYANGGAVSGVLYAPASDPFVITVGAVDIGKDSNVKNDVAAPWSAWGYTRDGFLKPEISAPGRYMIAATPPSSTLARNGGQDPKLVTNGFLQLSGTSFAAPVVAGAAAALLAQHPDWTPDQVKGALMLSASHLPSAVFGSVGVGELDLKKAIEKVDSPPNPNAALDGFVVSTPAGPVFDAASWSSTAMANASWSSASWSSASWSSASWSSASWSSASWSSASWSSASWSSASWNSASWSSVSWTSAMVGSGLGLVDNAVYDGPGEG